MIIDTLDQRHRYAHDRGLTAALEVISSLDATTAPGTHIDLGEAVGHITVMEFTSVDPVTKTQYEAHQRFADIHVVLAGEERIDVASLHALTPITPFDERADIGLHKGPSTVTVTLTPGWFVVCYPSDAHLPGTQVSEPARVLKAVGKLRVD